MTTILNDASINALVAARNNITDRTDDYPNWNAVKDIDAVLQQVEPGQRNDVDLLLGRPTARLAARVVDAIEAEATRRGWTAAQAVTVEEVEMLTEQKVNDYNLTTQQMIDISREAMQNQPPIEY